MEQRRVILCFLMIGTGCSRTSPHEQMTTYLEEAKSRYSTVAESARVDVERQLDELRRAYKIESDSKNRMGDRSDVGLGSASSALLCTQLMQTLRDFRAQQQLSEATTAEEFDKFIESFSELSRVADNLVRKPNINEATPASDRLLLKEAQSLVKQAHDLAVTIRPPT
jgi:hypothetical protein